MSSTNQQPRRRSRRLIMLAATVVAAAGIIAGVLSSMAGATSAGSPSAHMPAAKAALFEQEALQLARQRQHPLPKSDAIMPAMAPAAPLAPLTGITQIRQAPFSNSWFTVRNNWTGIVDGTYYTVYAGALQHPDTGATPQAGVVVYQDPANVNAGQHAQRVGVYLVASGNEPLTVESASDSTLTLSNGSQTVTFDAATCTFH